MAQAWAAFAGSGWLLSLPHLVLSSLQISVSSKGTLKIQEKVTREVTQY